MGFIKKRKRLKRKNLPRQKDLRKANFFPSFCPKNFNFQNKIKTSFMPQPKRASRRNLVNT